MDRERFYRPTRNGYEARIRERLEHWAELRAELRSQEDPG
jgi:putative ATPase